MKLNVSGWLFSEAGVVLSPSPHFDARPENSKVELVVMHNISLPPSEFGGGYIRDFFLGRLDTSLHPYFKIIEGVRVSSHFLLDRLGNTEQFVSVLERAWHAGVSSAIINGETRQRCNDFSIGIELEGDDASSFTTAQYNSLSALLQALVAYFPQLNLITGHSDIAPGRKTDPGEYFDWARVLAQKPWQKL